MPGSKEKHYKTEHLGQLSLCDEHSVLGPQEVTAQEALEEELRIACCESISYCPASKKLCPQHAACCSGLCRPISRQ